MSKIAERSIAQRLLEVRMDLDIIPEGHFGFRSQQSTEHQELRLLEYAPKGLNKETIRTFIARQIRLQDGPPWLPKKPSRAVR